MSVWDDITDSPAEAANMKVRSALMRAVRDRIEAFGWSQTVAAANLGVTQPRVSELMTGKVSRFSLDALVAMGDKVGVHVTVSVDTPDEHPEVAVTKRMMHR